MEILRISFRFSSAEQLSYEHATSHKRKCIGKTSFGQNILLIHTQKCYAKFFDLYGKRFYSLVISCCCIFYFCWESVITVILDSAAEVWINFILCMCR